jgi:predicted dienelactone hydrolase
VSQLKLEQTMTLLQYRPAAFCLAILSALSILISTPAKAENRIDTQLPSAPELSAYGEYKVGVRTLKLTNPKQIDVARLIAQQSGADNIPYYDRALSIELWYPTSADSEGEQVLRAYLRDATQEVSLHGQGIRDAAPRRNQSEYPFVIISHGYPGNRYLMAHLGENLASKGYVVASIDHTDSTYRTLGAFASTLVNRPLDQSFVLDQIQALNQDSNSFLYKMVDTQNTALIGYSMGAYGAVIMAGAGITEAAVSMPGSAPHNLLKIYQQGSEEQSNRPDPRLKTIIAFAPWGMNYGVWNKQGLSDISIPMLLVAGSVDDVSGYENGVRAIWENAINSERALLTFENANHSAGAPMPAPKESYYFNDALGLNISAHYTDAVWDSARMNNISQHFATAWLGKHLKSDSTMDSYLDLVPRSNDGVWSMDAQNKPSAEHTHWHGFINRTAKGLRFERLNN